MRTTAELLAATALLTFSLAAATSHSPPRLKAQLPEPRVVVAAGTNVKLMCPVDGDTSLMLFEWLKDRRPVAGQDGKRLRGANSGSLKIHSVVLEDSGLYTCRVVNGFGTVNMNYTLVVEDPLSAHEGAIYPQEDNLYPVRDLDALNVHPSRPKFIRFTPLENGVIQRPVGSNVRLKCHATGEPSPQIVWWKNGRLLSDTGLRPEFRRNRYSLMLFDLQERDSGVYTCLACNALCSVGANFTLEVIGVIKEKPQISGPDPENVTVDYGGTAVFKCQVRSKAPPHIKWLKQVSEEEEQETNRKLQNSNRKLQNFIPVNDDLYRVLNFSEAAVRPDGSFLNKLYISGASERDSGKYICWAANIKGYSYRTAYLTVLPNLRAEVATIPRDEARYSVVLYFIIATIILTILVVIVGCCFMRTQTIVAIPFKNNPHEEDGSETCPNDLSHRYMGRANLVALTSGTLNDRLSSE